MANQPPEFGWATEPPISKQIFYPLGAYLRNSAPAVGQPDGWVCVAEGNPGTWAVTTTTAGVSASNSSALKYTVAYTNAAFKTASTDVSVILAALPARAKILGVTINHTTAYSGAGVTSVVVSVGDGTSAYDQYAGAFDIFQATSPTTFADSNTHASTSMAASNLVARFTANTNFGTGTATVLTAGSVDIYVVTLPLP